MTTTIADLRAAAQAQGCPYHDMKCHARRFTDCTGKCPRAMLLAAVDAVERKLKQLSLEGKGLALSESGCAIPESLRLEAVNLGLTALLASSYRNTESDDETPRISP